MFDEEIMEANIDTLIAIGDCLSKEVYMESVTENTPVPDPEKKWTRFVNWVKRVITTIVARIQSSRFKNNLKRCSNFDTGRKDFKVDARDNYLIGKLVTRNKIRDVYENQGLAYNRSDGAKYATKTKQYQKMMEALNHYKDYPDDDVNINGAQLRKYMEWIETQGKKMAIQLPKLNGYLNEISMKLQKEDKTDKSFRQYTQYITLMMQVDLIIVKHMVEFMDRLRRRNNLKKSGSDPVTSGSFQKQASGENKPKPKPTSTTTSASSSNKPDASTTSTTNPKPEPPSTTPQKPDTSTQKPEPPKDSKPKHDSHGCLMRDTPPDWIKDNTPTLRSVKFDKNPLTNGAIYTAIEWAADKWVFKNYSKTKRVYSSFDKDRRELLFAFNALEDSDSDWRSTAMAQSYLQKLKIPDVAINDIIDAFDKYGAAYVDKKK